MQERLAPLQEQSQAFLLAVSKDILIPVLQITYVLLYSVPMGLPYSGHQRCTCCLPISTTLERILVM